MPNPFLPSIHSLLPEPQASLLAGILFGVASRMPKDLYQNLLDTGTLHIIALSGMNISILVTLIAQMTIFLGKKISTIVTIFLIAGFVFFVGPSPSVVRAAIMGSMSLIAVYFGRKNWGLLSLVLTAGIMLLWNFSLMKDLSFQLSFLATLGILLAGGNLKRQVKSGLLHQLLSPIKENFRLTLSAQLFTLPVILYNFHRISLIAPLANVAIEWAIQPIMVLGFVTAFFGWIWQPFGMIPAWFVWVPLTYVLIVIEILARIPFASIRF